MTICLGLNAFNAEICILNADLYSILCRNLYLKRRYLHLKTEMLVFRCRYLRDTNTNISIRIRYKNIRLSCHILKF